MDKLSSIRQQKQQIKKKIMELEGEKVPQNNLTQEAMALLYQKKAKLEHQRVEQQKYRKLQAQYNARKDQAQRQKQLQRIRNQKRMIELQVGMKRIVLNGVQEKVKGINSEQLLTRAMLNNGEKGLDNRTKGQKGDIKKQFQKYLSKQNIKREQPKHDIYELNQKRYQLFTKKQQLLMRQILLKELVMNKHSSNNQAEGQEDNMLDSNQDEQQIDVMRCSKQQLQRLLQQNNINIDDYMHPLDSKEIISNIQKIQSSIITNLGSKKSQLLRQKEQQTNYQKHIQSLKQWTGKHPNRALLGMVKQLVAEIADEMVLNYEKRHFASTKEEKYQRIAKLKQDYEQLQNENQYFDLAEQFFSQIQTNLRKQLILQAVQEVHNLHQFTHEATALSFDWLFNKKNYLDCRNGQDKRLNEIKLTFKDQSDNIRYDKQQNPSNQNNQNKQSQSNIFQTQKNTSQLINDIKLLATQEHYFHQITIQVKRQINDAIDQNDFRVHNQNGLYIITPNGIKLINQEKDMSKHVIVFQKQIKNIKNTKKLNNTWIIQTNQYIFIQNSWNIQRLPMAIGQRINGACGSFTNLCIYPTFSLLGSLCNILISFQKGQIMKYNFNRNRITSEQTNVTMYLPLGPAIKTVDQPAFPLNNRHVIQYKNQKVKDTESIHEFRQFFDHHFIEIISVCYFKDNFFLTVDKQLNCAIWFYDMRRGIKSYDPYYTFQIRSEYKVYKQSQNPRFRDLYPSSGVPESQQELYKRWMEHETYLKLQIYNNPKKNNAYFKSPKWDNQKSQQPVWKILYDDKQKKVIKIFETYHNIVDGKSQCKQVKIWRQYAIFLVERQHVMRNDLKTIKIYTWSMEQRKLRTVAIQFDTFQEQKSINFAILQNKFESNDFPLMGVISSGKILLFSMMSGQLLKDISEQPSCSIVKNYNFSSIQKGYFDNFYGITRRNIVEFVIKNKNTKQKKEEFNRITQITRKKYNNLI